MVRKLKLIETGLPLATINKWANQEKSLRHGHPATLHLWWARRPIGVCRVVLFASIVDTPDDPAERKYLWDLMGRLAEWDCGEDVLDEARWAMRVDQGPDLPPVVDPFCGGGSTLIAAQELGLAAYGGDMNPVAVLVSKGLVEIPHRFWDQPPVNSEARERMRVGALLGEQMGLFG